MEFSQHWSRYWLGTCVVPSHLLNQYWHILSIEPLRKKWYQLNYLHEKAIENVWKMSAILFRHQCVYSSHSAFCCNCGEYYMMMSSNGNIFHVNGPLLGESTGHQWIPLSKACDTELWCVLWSAPEQAVKQTNEMPVIWDAITLIMTSMWW